MGFHEPHDKENPPASTPIRVHDGISQSGDAHDGGVMQGSFSSNADLTSSPFTSLPPALSPLANNNDPIQFGTIAEFNDILMTSGENLIRLHGPPITTSSINNSNVAPQFLCPPEMHHDSTNDCNMANADSVINQGGFQNPDVSMEFLSNHVAVDEANSFGVESAGDPKMSVLQRAQNIGGTGSKNDFQLIDAQFSSPKNIDKRLQTLGIGGNRQPSRQRSRTKFSTKEIAGSSPAYGLGSSTFLANDDAAMHRPSESSFSFSQTEQTDNSGFVGQTSSRHSQMYLPQGFPAQRAAEQTPSSTNIAGNMPPEFIYAHIPMGNRGLVGQNHLAQITSEQLPFYGNSVRNMSPESSMYFHTPMINGGFARDNRLGGSGTQTFEGSPFPLSVQPVGQQSSSGQVTPLPLFGNSYFPQGMGIQIAESSNIQPVIRNQFPARLGISQAGQEHLLHNLWRTQQLGYYQHQAHVGHVQRPMSFLIGPRHGSVPVQTINTLPGADYIIGQGIPTANVTAIPQASNIHGQPSLRRRARESPSVGSSRKIVGRHRSMPYPGHNLHRPPPTPRPSAPVVWQDSSQSLKPSGHKRLLCKRDVKFTPDGPVSQPSTPPVVAVLPCGHVFHDQCLQKITPVDQSNDPPCIPCATGET